MSREKPLSIENSQLNFLDDLDKAGPRPKPEKIKSEIKPEDEAGISDPKTKEEEHWQKVFPEFKEKEKHDRLAEKWLKKIKDDIDEYAAGKKESVEENVLEPDAAKSDTKPDTKPDTDYIEPFGPGDEYYGRFNDYRDKKK